MKITGRTRVFYCMADPVDQVRAPEVFNAVFAKHGVDAVMVPSRVPAAHLEATLRALFESPSVGGVSLSIPHKAATASIVDWRSPAATVANAVNAVRRTPAGLERERFDGEGFDMLIQQTPLYLEFFGYPELAASVRADDAYLQDMLLPAGMTAHRNLMACQ
jgi:shikimate 5-dehydrogenase